MNAAKHPQCPSGAQGLRPPRDVPGSRRIVGWLGGQTSAHSSLRESGGLAQGHAPRPAHRAPRGRVGLLLCPACPYSPLPMGQRSAMARAKPVSIQNALWEAHREIQGRLFAPVGKMAPATLAPSRVITRSSLPPSIQNGASCWSPRISITHLSVRWCRLGMSGSVNQSYTGTLSPPFAIATQALTRRPGSYDVTRRGVMKGGFLTGG